MDKPTPSRKSHCSVCGKRLSVMTAEGAISWQAGGVDDKGIYCDTCLEQKKNISGKRGNGK